MTNEQIPVKQVDQDKRLYLSWGAVSFIEAPSMWVLSMAISALAITLVGCFVASFFVELEVSVKASGPVDYVRGVKEAVSQTQGQVYYLPVVEGDKVKKDQTIAWIRMAGTHEARLRGVIDLMTKKAGELNDKTVATDDFVSTLRDIEDPTLKSLLFDVQSKLGLFVRAKTELVAKAHRETAPLRARRSKVSQQLAYIRNSKMRSYLLMQQQGLEEERGRIDQQLATSENSIEDRTFSAQTEAAKAIEMARIGIDAYITKHQIKSPVEGVIGRVLVAAGTAVKDQQPIVTVLPGDSPLVAKVMVPSRDVSKVKEQMVVYMSIDAFPAHKYGYFKGSVLNVEKIVKTDAQGASAETYVARISLDPASIGRKPAMEFNRESEIQFFPGMKVEARIVSKRASLISLLYDKVFGKEP